MMTNMDTHDEAAAADFEQGWSAERIAAARRAWGPAVSDGLPVWLNRKLAERAHAEGRSKLGIIQEALTRYFTSEGVEVMDTTVESGTTYEVVTHREVSAEAGFWVFEIPALGVVGQAAKWGQVTDEARGIIAVWNEDGPDEDSVTVQVRLDGEAGAQRM